MAVFRGARLRGFLEGGTARGAMWVFGKMRDRYAFNPANGRPVINGERIIMNLEVEASSILSDWPELERRLDPQTIKSLEKNAASAIAGELLDTLSLLQKQYRADIFGFGAAIERRDPPGGGP